MALGKIGLTLPRLPKGRPLRGEFRASLPQRASQSPEGDGFEKEYVADGQRFLDTDVVTLGLDPRMTAGGYSRANASTGSSLEA
ncbi:MAG: hypothetical protein ABW043_20695, partial [Devosia sp.]|uniref:hypothetical protein n=1 Tax=Devosia sp. TaxID=1871048 RepID=UPI003396F8F3